MDPSRKKKDRPTLAVHSVTAASLLSSGICPSTTTANDTPMSSVDTCKHHEMRCLIIFRRFVHAKLRTTMRV